MYLRDKKKNNNTGIKQNIFSYVTFLRIQTYYCGDNSITLIFNRLIN